MRKITSDQIQDALQNNRAYYVTSPEEAQKAWDERHPMVASYFGNNKREVSLRAAEMAIRDCVTVVAFRDDSCLSDMARHSHPYGIRA